MPTTERRALLLAEERRLGPGRHRLTRLLLAVLAVGVAGAGYLGGRVLLGDLGDLGGLGLLGGPRCRATALGTSVDFDPGQTGHAATITALAVRRGLPPRAATIALATAIQESKLRNLRYGDRDSIGLFQQRPSQGWGTPEQILDPVRSTTAFYDALVTIRGYESMEITKVAQAVQRSAYPEAYADHEQEGRILASTMSGHSPGGLGCRLDDPEGPGDPAGHAARLRAELGVPAKVSGRTVTVAAGSPTLAWAAGAWSVAQAEQHGVTRVQVGDRAWTRTRDAEGWAWRTAPAGAATAVSISFAG